jgi:aspartate/methionine/tyrosine aminotransferase
MTSGGCYTKEVLVEYMKLCQRHKIHLISDEIYALSVFHNQELDRKGNFISVLSIDTTGIIDPELVHVIWGLSKVGRDIGSRYAAKSTCRTSRLTASVLA